MQHLVATCHTVLHVAFLAQFMDEFRMISPLQFRRFFTSDTMHDMNFPDRVFFAFGVPPFRVHNWWVEIPKGTPSEYMISIGVIGLQENVPVGCVQDTGNAAVLLSLKSR